MKLVRGIGAGLQAMVIFGICGCGEPQATVSAPDAYRQAGLEFSYPSNWKVTEDIREPGLRMVMLETSGNALVIIQIFPTTGGESLQEFARQFSEQSAAETPGGKVSSLGFSEMSDAHGFQRLAEDFHIEMLGEKVPHHRTFLRKEIGTDSCHLIFQVAKEDLSQVAAGFELITSTFTFQPAAP